MPTATDLAGRPQGRPASGLPARSLPIRVTRLALELLLASLAVGVLGTVLLARGVPMTGRLVFVVAGGSMEPSLHLGSAVIVQPVSAASLAVGDIVTIEVGPEHAIFTHRITRLVDRPDGLWIETKGDANESPDPSIIPATAVLGRVQLAVPGLGYAVAALSQPSGIGIAFGLAGLLVAFILLVDGAERGESSSRRPDVQAGTLPVLVPSSATSVTPPEPPRPSRRRAASRTAARRSIGSVGGG